VEQFATVADDAVLGHLTGGDLVHLRLQLGGHLRRRHRRHVFLERLVHRDPGLRGDRRVAVDVAAVEELLDDVGAVALAHHLDQFTCEIRRAAGAACRRSRGAAERQFFPFSAGISSSAERA
jgi:hypothetical protein